MPPRKINRPAVVTIRLGLEEYLAFSQMAADLELTHSMLGRVALEYMVTEHPEPITLVEYLKLRLESEDDDA